MANNDSGQKTEKPTPRRLREARNKGQIPRSVDLVQWLTLLAASFLLPSTIGGVLDRLEDRFAEALAFAASGDVGPTLEATARMSGYGLLGLTTLFGFVVASSILGMAAQGGVVFTAHPLKPKMERISPKAGFKRLFSVQSVMETGKAVIRLFVLGIIVATTLTGAAAGHLLGAQLSLEAATNLLIDEVLLIIRLSALIGSIIGMADYAFQRWQSMKKLKMSKHEVKQDQKSSEGDPVIRSRRRAAHQKLTRNQVLSAVSESTVIVTNPTHFAVALYYGEDGSAPVVKAKGSDELAMRIRERGKIAEVPIIESPPLARALHASVEIGEAIPEEFFEAVAIVLAFVMRPRRNRLEGPRQVTVPPSKIPQRSSA